MKKLILSTITGLLTCFLAIGQGTGAQYTLPIEFTTIPAVAVQPKTGDMNKSSYNELTNQITNLQNDLGTQNSNLNTNTNYQQIYANLGTQFNDTSLYSDSEKTKKTKENYDTIMARIKSNISISKSNINVITQDIESIKQIINNRMNSDKAQNDFRTWTSGIFAILLAIIIASFYYVLYKTNAPDVASILVGESGLQFITLFSLIISIILFGVLNILEGKELAAIISAIAGFILGKHNPTSVLNNPILPNNPGPNNPAVPNPVHPVNGPDNLVPN